MVVMWESLSTPHNRHRTYALLGISVALALAAAAVGVDDNPPGLLLAFLSGAAFTVAFVHPWRTTRKFQALMMASILGLVVFAILHNVFHALATVVGPSGLAGNLVGGLGILSFFIALLLCPPAFLVGMVGAIVMFFRERGSGTRAHTA
jgi:hypothetical protein